MEKIRVKPKRLLCIVSSMNTGGAETFLMKIFRNLDRENYQMDFYCMSMENGFYENEIISLGGKVYHSIPKSKNPLKSFLELKKIVEDEKYDSVMRISQHSLATLDLIAAKMGGAKILIQRSSNSNSSSYFGKILHFVFKWLPKKIPTIKLAPSTEAAEYTFGKNSVKKLEVNLIKNALNIEDFIFDNKKRQEIRSEFNITNKFVIGHIGRISMQKNHNFLIDIFKEVVKKEENSLLLIIGVGELEAEIKEKIKKNNLEDKVIFTGIRSDIPSLLMAMDVFVFPSLYEGLPNTVIEAQATGLPCVISDKITKEVKITQSVYRKSLEENESIWAEKILSLKNINRNVDVKKEFIRAGYDINSVVEKLEKTIFYA